LKSQIATSSGAHARRRPIFNFPSSILNRGAAAPPAPREKGRSKKEKDLLPLKSFLLNLESRQRRAQPRRIGFHVKP
jgi:hypothetical protein